MKKILLVSFFIAASLLFSIGAYAEEEEEDYLSDSEDANYGFETDDIQYAKTPLNKLGRGLINTATCWTEVPGEFAKVSKETNPAIGSTLGVAEGVVTAVVRGAMGLFDVFTCVIPPYDKPIMKPEYAMNRADKYIKDYLW